MSARKVHLRSALMNHPSYSVMARLAHVGMYANSAGLGPAEVAVHKWVRESLANAAKAQAKVDKHMKSLKEAA